MKGNHRIRTILKERCVVLDGATGTELQKRGMPPGTCPEAWCLDNPGVTRGIHEDYLKAGADIVYACTFGANRLKLAQYNHSDVYGMNRDLARIARLAAGRQGIVAGDIGSTGHFVEPFGDLPFEEAVALFSEQIRGLVDGGVDLLVIETMMDIQEARAALLAARETADIFTMVTMTFEEGGRTLNGTDPAAALVTLQSLGADAVGCNCSSGPAEMVRLMEAMSPLRTVPLIAKPNAGMPQVKDGATFFSMTPGEFAAYARPFLSLGVEFLGGCCGTTPEHIRALKEALRVAGPARRPLHPASALSSCRKALTIEQGKPLLIVGEGINPTGKPALQEELRRGHTGIMERLGRDQEAQGADLLDVNVGAPGVDQPAMMVSALKALSRATSLPLVIDSPDPAAIEAGLRIYPGRALINSISGEPARLEALLSLAARYGAMFILLPLAGGGVPKSAGERRDIIRSVYREARRKGFTRRDIVIDGLVMTVSSDPAAAVETLETVEWATRSFKCPTILGLTNVSHGLPARKWLNAAFLAMAQSRGLTMAIANPSQEEFMHVKAGSDVLTGRDRDGAAYCGRFAEGTTETRHPGSGTDQLSTEEKIARAVREGSREGIEALLKTALDDGIEPGDILSGMLIPTISDVGVRYERKEFFLPQLVAAAETMQRGVAFLEPLIKKSRKESASPGTIVMATVEGDIHDIGKNIVILMLKNHGYTIIDLGKDVPAERIIGEARRTRADLVGLSALMTTTMTAMEKTVLQARREGLACPIMVGGAVVTPSWASSIGAHYARDGVDAVRRAGSLLREASKKKKGGA